MHILAPISPGLLRHLRENARELCSLSLFLPHHSLPSFCRHLSSSHRVSLMLISIGIIFPFYSVPLSLSLSLSPHVGERLFHSLVPKKRLSLSLAFLLTISLSFSVIIIISPPQSLSLSLSLPLAFAREYYPSFMRHF